MNERFFRNREGKLAAETLHIEAERAIAGAIICLQMRSQLMLRITIKLKGELNDAPDNKT